MSKSGTSKQRYTATVAWRCIALAIAGPLALAPRTAHAQFFDAPGPGEIDEPFRPGGRQVVSGDLTSAQSKPALSMRSVGGSDIGPYGDGSRSENMLLTFRSGTLSLSGDDGVGILVETKGGDGRSIPRGTREPGGSGGRGGDIDILLEPAATIRTSGRSAHGVQAVSTGGDGGNGGDGRVFGPTGKPGGDGGAAGHITIVNRGTIVTSGEGAFGLYARNAGGRGGNGGDDKGIVFSRGGKAGEAGGQFEITVDNSGSITTSGDHGIGIFAKSLGGGGGDGGDAKGGLVSIGGRGGNSGDGGDIIVTNSRSVLTSGRFAAGLSLETTGGGGSAGGSALAATPGLFNVAVGGDAGSNGDGGQIKAINGGTIITRGELSPAIKAASTGGGGGTAGTANVIGSINLFSLGLGGSAGDGGRGGRVEVNNNGRLETHEAQSEGILAVSTGGGGGQGGAAKVLGIVSVLKLGIGGAGGAGGDGGAVTVANGGQIVTKGAQSAAISALSVGGGGGHGGAADVISVSPTANISLAIGATGGAGGNGGAVHVHNGDAGTIVTEKAGSSGIKAQSIGQGGGNGSMASSSALTIGLAPSTDPISAVSFNMALGGSGAAGGGGGPVTVGNTGAITTGGAFADGIFAQSAGGGGGEGGFALTRSLTIAAGHAVTIASTIGGKGGIGGRGSGVLVESSGRITTTGDSAMGILAQSVGGGGGKGGGVFTSMGASYSSIAERWTNPTQVTAHSIALSIAVGGEGGIGNAGDNVIVRNAGAISTSGANAFGIVAQSIGGGGGMGGNSQTLTGGSATVTANVTVGGKGGAGNHGGKVDVSNTGDITTKGSGSAALFAQSVGGGGGHGGSASTLSHEVYDAAFAAGGNVNGIASLWQALRQAKGDPDFLKSWGQKKWDISASVSTGIALGGNGLGGGDGGDVKVENTKSLQTEGERSPGIFAQSVGGGGGNAGAVKNDEEENKIANIAGLIAKVVELGLGAKAFSAFKALDLSFSTNINVGGQGGSGGSGGVVAVNNRGTISTKSAESPGILAQSIGGGGGNGGQIGQEAEAPPAFSLPSVLDLLPLSPSGNVTIGVGGKGGANGSGSVVIVSNSGTIATAGASSEGILAQSIGGGGGNGGSSNSAVGSANLNLAIDIGGRGGAAGMGSFVAVHHEGGAISTSGANSAGIVAQSVGGGGGRSAASTIGGGLAIEHLTHKSQVKAGTAGSGGGLGGPVQVIAKGAVTTKGEQSAGIVAQSIGGGGGLVTLQVVLDEKTLRPELPAPTRTTDTTLVLGASGGIQGDGGEVRVNLEGALQTSGVNAFGVLAQGIGGGGGFVAAPASEVENGPLRVTLGASDGATGHGGAVNVQVGTITTSGRNAHGIVAQSIGAGGGVAGLTTSAGKVSLDRASKGGFGDARSVSVGVAGKVSTTGDGAIGVLAQAIGGGGGLTGDAASVRYGPGLVRDSSFVGGAGEGGDIAIRVNGEVGTAGANAPAILAMSLGSGAVFSDQGIMLMRPWEAAGNSGRLIDISVGDNGKVSATGAGSPGIYAVSMGNSGAGVGGNHRGEEIRINIGARASVSGGTGDQAAGIATITPALTVITNAGTVSALGGLAIQTANRARIENSGTVVGNVLLGAGSTFENREPGRLHSGTTLRMATLNNAGILNPGGENALGATSFSFVRTALDGSLQQSATGRYAVDLDYYDRKGDFLSVSAPSRFDGKVKPLPLRALRDIPLEIARFEQPLSSYGAVIDDRSPVFHYDLKQSGQQSVTIAMGAKFAPDGLALAKDQAATANYLQQVWDQQGPDSPADGARETASRIFGHLSRVQSQEAYLGALKEISNDATGARGAAMANEARAFAERLNSCPAFVSADASMREVDCVWGRSIATRIDRSGSIDDSGYRTKQLTLQVGGQKQVSPGWFLGGSLGYSAAHTTTSYDDVDIRSQGVMAGAVLKREIGPWLLSASLLAGYDTADLKRDVLLGSYFARASGTAHALQLGGKLRASYQFTFGNWYLKPMADLDLHFIKQYGYRERGAGLFDLVTLDQSRLGATLSPALEIGTRLEIAGMATRAYLNAGASFASQDGWQQRQRFSALGSGDGSPSFKSETGMPRAYGNARAGIDLVTKSGWELRAEYGLRAASGYREQSAELRAAFRF
ncbi:autotransporter outer membrane beta-barrel domain-containing protein [Bosea sp. WAO]|uniref:autotransporter outer membrane beta-barrel domain-containing protein n=1 Tax=Bosea sp. WAO TaxID=406341 RepID=UPI00082C0065|nr:autotransporter outer membrane beta-barrel domain-containing protein [Bosea sp. WAO]